MSDIDLKALREAAKQAHGRDQTYARWDSSGEIVWFADGDSAAIADPMSVRPPILSCSGNFGAFPDCIDAEDVAQFVALCCPANILALLDRLESAESERDALRKDAGRYRWLCGADVPPHSTRWPRWRLEYWGGFHAGWNPVMGSELDQAVDAAMAQEGGAETPVRNAGNGVDAGVEGGAEVAADSHEWIAAGIKPTEKGQYEMESYWPHRKVFRVQWDGDQWMNPATCLSFDRGHLCRWRRPVTQEGGK